MEAVGHVVVVGKTAGFLPQKESLQWRLSRRYCLRWRGGHASMGYVLGC
jgi:hypothetical protein